MDFSTRRLHFYRLNENGRPLLSGLTARQIGEFTLEELKRINELNVYLSYGVKTFLFLDIHPEGDNLFK